MTSSVTNVTDTVTLLEIAAAGRDLPEGANIPVPPRGAGAGAAAEVGAGAGADPGAGAGLTRGPGVVLGVVVAVPRRANDLDPEVEVDPSRNPDPALDPVDPVPNPSPNPSQDPSLEERVPPSQSPNHGQCLVNKTWIDLM